MSLRDKLERHVNRVHNYPVVVNLSDADAAKVLALLAAAKKDSPAPEDRAALKATVAAFEEE